LPAGPPNFYFHLPKGKIHLPPTIEPGIFLPWREQCAMTSIQVKALLLSPFKKKSNCLYFCMALNVVKIVHLSWKISAGEFFVIFGELTRKN